MIGRGHKKEEILREYTTEELKWFFEAATENWKQEQLAFALAVRIAVNGNVKDWRKYIKTLMPDKDRRVAAPLATKDQLMALQEMFDGRSRDRKTGRKA